MRLLAASLFAASLLAAAPAFADSVGAISVAPKAQTEFHKNYGDAEAVELRAYVQTQLGRELAKRGVADGALTVHTEIVSAAPTRPTWAQLSRNVSLSMESISLGGAELKATLVDAQGAVVDEVRYRYYESDLSLAQAAAPWTDAHNAICRFAQKVADAYAAKAA